METTVNEVTVGAVGIPSHFQLGSPAVAAVRIGSEMHWYRDQWQADVNVDSIVDFGTFMCHLIEKGINHLMSLPPEKQLGFVRALKLIAGQARDPKSQGHTIH